MFETKARDLGGRIGKLITRHGSIETPFLFPVVDPARQTPSLQVLRDIGFNGFITNAYLFYKRNKGVAKPIHRELSWDQVIMTDSGGYQILVYGDVDVDNKTIVDYEKKIGTDIAVILDIPTGTKMTHEDAERAVEETYRRGIEALPWIMDSDQLWVFPVQGAPYRDLYKRSLEYARRLPYDVYAVGSPTVMLERYKYSRLIELVLIARYKLPQGKPIHVFGVGHPMIIPFLVAAGGDLFDSASYILYARDGRYMVDYGTKRLNELEYFPCVCPVCSKYTPRDIIEMPEQERTRLLAIHNLYALRKELDSTKQAIREGRLWELLEHKSRSHPSLLEAFSVLKKYIRLVDKTSPIVNPGGRALLIYDEDSYYNPRLRLNIERSQEIIAKRVRNKIVVLIPAYRKPYNIQEEYRVLDRLDIKAVKLFIHPYLGLFTPGVVYTYPYYQHESRILGERISPERIASLIRRLLEYGASRVVIIESAWFKRKLFDEVLTRLGEAKDRVSICRLDEIFSQIPQ